MLFVLVLMISSVTFAKVGFVDARKALETVNEGKRVLAKLEGELKKRETKVKAEQDKIQKAQESLRKQAALLSESALASKQQEFQKMMMSYQETAGKMQKELQTLEGDLKKPLIEKMGKVIEEISKAEGVDVTYEALQAPLFIKSKIDLTSKVIDAYNKQYK